MDMFYNNPIRTFLVLCCLLMTGTAALAQVTSVACFKDVVISTNDNACTATVDKLMVGNIAAAAAAAEISIDGAAFTAASVPNVSIGKHLFELKQGNSTCWGYLYVEDKVKPQVVFNLGLTLSCSTSPSILIPTISATKAGAATVAEGLYFVMSNGNFAVAEDVSVVSNGSGVSGVYTFTNKNNNASKIEMRYYSGVAGVGSTLLHTFSDNCAIKSISFNDQTTEGCLNAASGLVRTISRTYTVLDVNGNIIGTSPFVSAFTFTKPVAATLNGILLPGDANYVCPAAPAGAPANFACNMMSCAVPAALTDAASYGKKVTLSGTDYFYTTGLPRVTTAAVAGAAAAAKAAADIHKAATDAANAAANNASTVVTNPASNAAQIQAAADAAKAAADAAKVTGANAKVAADAAAAAATPGTAAATAAAAAATDANNAAVAASNVAASAATAAATPIAANIGAHTANMVASVAAANMAATSAAAALAAAAKEPVLANSTNSVEIPADRAGASSTSSSCMITASYSDQFIAGCTAKVGKIVRTWTVIDMCTKVSKTGVQIITVMAEAPVVTLADEDKNCDVTTLAAATTAKAGNADLTIGNDGWSAVQHIVSTDAGACTSSAGMLGSYTYSSTCGEGNLTNADFTINDFTPMRRWGCNTHDIKRGVTFPMQLNGLGAKVPNLPSGEYQVTVVFTSSCGTQSAPVKYTLRVVDKEAPVVIADNTLVVSLATGVSSDGTVKGISRIYASAIDKGSRDNCGIGTIDAFGKLDIQVAVMTPGKQPSELTYADYQEVSCDVNPMLVLRVGDCARNRNQYCGDVSAPNYNYAMVSLTIQDKSPAVCIAPGDMSMDCSVWFNSVKPLVSSGTTTVTSQDNGQAINAFDKLFGNPNASSYSCAGAITQSAAVSVDACGAGKITRTFTVQKSGINGSTSATCTQVVAFTTNRPQSFFATFPATSNATCGNFDPTTTGKPVISNQGPCENIQVSYSDEVFVADGLDPFDPTTKKCKKIYRTWKVINMCLYSPTRNNYLPEGDYDCVYDANATRIDSEGDIVFKNTAFAGNDAVGFSGYIKKKTVTACTATDPFNSAHPFIRNVYVSGEMPLVGGSPVAANDNTVLDNKSTSDNCDDDYQAVASPDPNCNTSNFPVLGNGNGGQVNNTMRARRGNILWIDRVDGKAKIRDRAGDGIVRYLQVINVVDTQNPVLYNCTKPEVVTEYLAASYPADRFCEGVTTIGKTADDICSGAKVKMTLSIAVEDGTRLFTAADGSSVASKDFTSAATTGTSANGASATLSFTGSLPLKTTLVATWTATDECGNTASCSDRFKVLDKKAPSIQCRDIYSSAMQVSAGQLMVGPLGVSKFVIMAGDNCVTGMKNLRYSFNDKGTGPGVVITAADTTKQWVCADFRATGYATVRVYVYDESGNSAFCEPSLFINASDRTSCAGAGAASVAGLIQNETSEGVEKVTVKLNADAGVTAIETGTDGKFNYNLPIGKDYSVNPAKTTGLLNGVSTYDLVLIQKHILDVEKLNSSYKVVAADVNKDGKVTTLDIVELRKAILRISTSFPNGNNSWRFVSKNYAFSSTEGAAGETFPETYNINNLKAQQKADFVGVKVGDVNESAAPNSLIGAEERGARKAFVMNAEDRIVKAGEEVAMNVVADAANVAGFQYTMNFDKNALEFAGVKAGAINVTDANVAVVEGALTTSWNGEATNGNLFTVVFRAKADGRLSELVNVNSRYTEAEAYTKQAETMNVELRFNGTAANGFALFQNQPNPFTKETIIGFNLPSAQAATLKVYDVTGKAVKVVNADYAKGYNEVKIADLKATGVLYYTLETQGFTATKKMVIVE